MCVGICVDVGGSWVAMSSRLCTKVHHRVCGRPLSCPNRAVVQAMHSEGHRREGGGADVWQMESCAGGVLPFRGLGELTVESLARVTIVRGAFFVPFVDSAFGELTVESLARVSNRKR